MKINAWIFWQAVESEQAQTSLNKNWGLLHADFTGGNKYYIPKKYYAVRQFSNFIRPLSKMIDINNNDAVAFISSKQNQLIIVQRNASTSTVSYDYKLSNFKTIGPIASVWRTSSSENCKKVSDASITNGTLSTTTPAQSITTYVIQLDITSAISKTRTSNPSFIRCNNGNLDIQCVSSLSHAFLKVYNLKGTLLKTIPLTTSSGIFSVSYNLSDLPNGNYFVEISSGKQILGTSKIIMTK
jgi:hypothetical protein